MVIRQCRPRCRLPSESRVSRRCGEPLAPKRTRRAAPPTPSRPSRAPRHSRPSLRSRFVRETVWLVFMLPRLCICCRAERPAPLARASGAETCAIGGEARVHCKRKCARMHTLHFTAFMRAVRAHCADKVYRARCMHAARAQCTAWCTARERVHRMLQPCATCTVRAMYVCVVVHAHQRTANCPFA